MKHNICGNGTGKESNENSSLELTLCPSTSDSGTGEESSQEAKVELKDPGFK
ncbi:hypothetical protein QJS04_geneDACA021357 [Acorus gramineus]|uniref:Uncharacterized protein n=1 Tax=Acorus gramineus TaxID=55184 RepID=A0AAV9AN10_ACOGR|nr:hypothetical protein QJS04_geneDACA021357 [Acorus gramineus]